MKKQAEAATEPTSPLPDELELHLARLIWGYPEVLLRQAAEFSVWAMFRSEALATTIKTMAAYWIPAPPRSRPLLEKEFSETLVRMKRRWCNPDPVIDDAIRVAVSRRDIETVEKLFAQKMEQAILRHPVPAPF